MPRLQTSDANVGCCEIVSGLPWLTVSFRALLSPEKKREERINRVPAALWKMQEPLLTSVHANVTGFQEKGEILQGTVGKHYVRSSVTNRVRSAAMYAARSTYIRRTASVRCPRPVTTVTLSNWQSHNMNHCSLARESNNEMTIIGIRRGLRGFHTAPGMSVHSTPEDYSELWHERASERLDLSPYKGQSE